MWERLRTLATIPSERVEDNRGGSHLTMLSESGLIFGVINIVGNFGTVFLDQAYWQSAIAAKPSATYKGYILGGLSWFAIPFTLATSLGLASRALDLPISTDEANAGAHSRTPLFACSGWHRVTRVTLSVLAATALLRGDAACMQGWCRRQLRCTSWATGVLSLCSSCSSWPSPPPALPSRLLSPRSLPMMSTASTSTRRQLARTCAAAFIAFVCHCFGSP